MMSSMKTSEYENVFICRMCSDAQDWLETRSSLEEAWNNCERGDWLWWAFMCRKDETMETILKYSELFDLYDNFCTQKESADWIRENIPNPFIKEN